MSRSLPWADPSVSGQLPTNLMFTFCTVISIP